MSDFFKEMEAAIGANDDPTTVKSWLNTGSPLLNDAISGSYHGGLPVGRLIEMFGPSSSGKTAIATEAMIAAQRAGGVAGFMDHERSFDANLAAGNGLDTTKRWVFKAPRSFEDSLDLVAKAAATIRNKKLIAPEAPIIFVFDSLASMAPKSTIDKDLADFNMNDTTALARATSTGFRSLASFCEEFQFTALFLNQIRMKPGVMFGDPTTTPGGNAMEFYASVRISLSRSQITKGSGEAREVIGQTITAKCVKNKVHRPFEKAKWDFMFQEDGTGRFDPVGSVIDRLLDLEILKKATQGRLEWDGKTLHRNEVIKRIEESGDRLQLYRLLPGWEEDLRANPNVIDWNLAA